MGLVLMAQRMSDAKENHERLAAFAPFFTQFRLLPAPVAAWHKYIGSRALHSIPHFSASASGVWQHSAALRVGNPAFLHSAWAAVRAIRLRVIRRFPTQRGHICGAKREGF
jgi:hypothetical protein